MKIAINGDIIDIKSIYKISKLVKDCDDYLTFLKYGHIYIGFSIKFYGRKKLDVIIYTYTYWNGTDYCSINNPDKNIKEISNHYNGILKQCKESTIYKLQLGRITKIRQDILDLWSNNQKDIPKFSTETVETTKTEKEEE